MKTVLFIDDDDDESVEWYVSGLRDGGYRVELVNSAFAAQEVIAHSLHEFDLVILDLSMLPTTTMPPELVHRGLGTGVVLFQEVRTKCPDMPVIVLTNVFSKVILRNLPEDQPGRYKLLNKLDVLPRQLVEEVCNMMKSGVNAKPEIYHA